MDMAAAKNISESVFRYASDNIAVVNVIMAREGILGVDIDVKSFMEVYGQIWGILVIIFGITTTNIYEAILLLFQGWFGCNK